MKQPRHISSSGSVPSAVAVGQMKGKSMISDNRPETSVVSSQIGSIQRMLAVQRKSEEEMLQPKTEDDLKQMKVEDELPVQKASIEDEPKQMKMEDELKQPKMAAPIQRVENKTGMPDNLKSGVENLSGVSMNDVKVHYNSSKPAQLNALAYAQGTDIHVGAGQEKHLPHEAWHVVQQKQGRVQPTMMLKAATPVNDDAGLEKEADVMGSKAMQMKSPEEELKK